MWVESPHRERQPSAKSWGYGAKPPLPGAAQHSLLTAQPEYSVFRLLPGETERLRQKLLPPSEVGRPLIMHCIARALDKSTHYSTVSSLAFAQSGPHQMTPGLL